MKEIKIIKWKRNNEEKKENINNNNNNNKKHVTCNRCHKKEFNLEAIVYDCPKKGKEECHPGGYNLCIVCYSKIEKPTNLLITIYGNSPLNTVTEKGSKGGIFTHSVCQALSNNNGTIPLWKLCASMNIPLTNSSQNKQIVFKEGTAATMDKLLIDPHKTGNANYKHIVNVNIINLNNNKQIKRYNTLSHDESSNHSHISQHPLSTHSPNDPVPLSSSPPNIRPQAPPNTSQQHDSDQQSPTHNHVLSTDHYRIKQSQQQPQRIVEILLIIFIIILFVFDIIVAVIIVCEYFTNIDTPNILENVMPYLINNIFNPLHFIIQLLLILGWMEWLVTCQSKKK
eukprot:555252_1